MEHLWAPWRIEYILNSDKEDGCIFCNRLGRDDDDTDLIVYRGREAFIIMNKFPYNNGHVMVVPNRHIAEFCDLSPTEHTEMGELISLSISALKSSMNPHGFNIGMNLGRVSGAGIEDHLHYHIVPRWDGDTNFMPIIGGTKVVSEGLRESYQKIKEAVKEILGE
ncbi:MAG: HIT domain-containing protein [Calditrichia bacterium]